MDSLSAFFLGEANRHREMKVFDWNEAARIIKERGAEEASAGLSGDWEWTGGRIWNGKSVRREDTYTYLASTWATPELEVDGEVVPCFKMQSQLPGWDANTFWPESALKILEGK